MAVDYPEDLLPDNVIVSLSEDTETEPPYGSEAWEIAGRTAPHSAMTGLSDDLIGFDPGKLLILDELRECRALLTEIRDIAASVKIPAFLKGKK
jgi:hypothetical protein